MAGRIAQQQLDAAEALIIRTVPWRSLVREGYNSVGIYDRDYYREEQRPALLIPMSRRPSSAGSSPST